MKHRSLWLETAYADPVQAHVQESMECDVCIAGGGLSGMANAYLLAKDGLDVVLLEKDELLAGATGNSTGKLTVQHGPVYADMIKRFGVEGAKLYLAINQEALQVARSLAEADELAPAGSILYAGTATGMNTLKEELAAYGKLGLNGELGNDNETAVHMAGTLRLAQEAQIHPVRFGQHLARLAQQAGARIFTQSEVRNMDLDRHTVQTDAGHTVRYKQLVLCTHYPIEGIHGLQILKLTVDRSYVVSVAGEKPLQGQYISVDGPKRSFRTAQIDGAIHFLLSGEGHVAGMEGNTGVHYQKLSDELASLHGLSAATYGWSAQDPTTPDIIPYAGRISSGLPDVFISTGYRKWGLTNALACADIITSLIQGRRHKAAELFAPDRSGFGALLMQGLKTTGLVLKELPGGYLTRNDSPVCTHMGCRTRWNEADRTWDCPCHGSRFNEDGSVLEGPATKPLDLG